MKKLLVFDLDGTLCPDDKPMKFEDVEALRNLERDGCKIAVCSGKPVHYLCGFMRQVGIEEPILAGENGGIIQFGIVMPCDRVYHYPVSDEASRQLAAVKSCIDSLAAEKYAPGDLWFQPNEVEVTPFVKEGSMLDDIAGAIDKLDLSSINVYRFSDCFDFIPDNISKGNCLKYLASILGIDPADTIAFGDAVNDVSMFEAAGVSVKIGRSLEYEADYCFDTIGEALAQVRGM